MMYILNEVERTHIKHALEMEHKRYLKLLKKYPWKVRIYQAHADQVEATLKKIYAQEEIDAHS